MEFNDILEGLKRRDYHPVYFFCGEEPYYIDILAGYIEQNVLTEEEKGFNQQVFYGRDTDISAVIEAARRFPMMASRQVISVREAQHWKNLEPLARYLKNPSSSTLLAVSYKYGKPNLRTEAGKAIERGSIYLETKKLRDYQLPRWIENHAAGRGYTLTPQASQMLTDYLGADLGKVAGELEKLFLALPAGKRITPEEVEKNIGISKEYNMYELSDALREQNLLKSNRIAGYFIANPNACPFPLLISTLFSYFSKLLKFHYLEDRSEKALTQALGIHPYFVRKYAEAANRYGSSRLEQIIGILREYDLKSKGAEGTLSVTQGDLIREMVYKILH